MEKPVEVEHSAVADKIKYEEARHRRHIQTGFLVVLGIIVLCFFVPLGVFLTRLAMGT